MIRQKMLAVVLTLASAAIFSVSAAVGFGIHWGNDFSMGMDDKIDEQLVFDSLKINQIPNAPANRIFSGAELPIYVTRTDWNRKLINIGAKFYVDVIPFIDALELSSNFGVWEYKGSIKYPTSLTYKNPTTLNPTPDQLFDIVYTSKDITLKEFGMGYLGLRQTPYMKLNFDLTVKKYIFQFPPALKTLRLYGGGGASLTFATPVLSTKLVEDALGDRLNSIKNITNLNNTFSEKEIAQDIVEEIGKQLMTPHWGCHLDLGVMVKIPVLPIGIYVDGKLMIPFTKLDKSVDVGGRGFLLNTGVSLSF
jgi:hypothetical protein